MSSKTMVYW